MPVTTVYAKIKRMEDLGLVRQYATVLDGPKLGFAATAFILATFSYRAPGAAKNMLSQRAVAKEVAGFQRFRKFT